MNAFPKHFTALAPAFAIGFGACSASAGEIGATQAELVGGTVVSGSAWPSVGWLETGCTATLMHERVVVFAAHCGVEQKHLLLGSKIEIDFDREENSFEVIDSSAVRKVELTRCMGYETAAIGSGTDLAFCELAEPLTDVPALPPAVGCERESIAAGEDTWLVGYGFTSTVDTMPGEKRVARAAIERFEREIVIGNDEVGTCRGDSGGPAIVPAPAAPGEAPDWRVLGVLSSGAVGECGVGWYTDLAPLVPWLEEQSGYDLTPCFDGTGAWDPGPDCRAPALDADGEPIPGAQPYSQSCGEAYVPPASSCAVERGPGTPAKGSAALLLAAALLFDRRRRTAQARRPRR